MDQNGEGKEGRVPWGPCLSHTLTWPVTPEDAPAPGARPLLERLRPGVQDAGPERDPGREDAEGLLPQGVLSSQECGPPEAAPSRTQPARAP